MLRYTLHFRVRSLATGMNQRPRNLRPALLPITTEHRGSLAVTLRANRVILRRSNKATM